MEKQRKNELYKLFIQFVKFGFVGVSNTIISLGIYYLFLWLNPELYLVGNGFGFIVSVLNSYILNKKFVFNGKDASSKNTLLKTYVAYGITFLLGTLLIYVMVNYMGITKVMAPIINVCITTPINFVINKLWVHK